MGGRVVIQGRDRERAGGTGGQAGGSQGRQASARPRDSTGACGHDHSAGGMAARAACVGPFLGLCLLSPCTPPAGNCRCMLSFLLLHHIGAHHSDVVHLASPQLAQLKLAVLQAEGGAPGRAGGKQAACWRRVDRWARRSAASHAGARIRCRFIVAQGGQQQATKGSRAKACQLPGRTAARMARVQRIPATPTTRSIDPSFDSAVAAKMHPPHPHPP